MNNHTQPLDISKLSEEQLNEELEKGYEDIAAGRTKLAEEVFADIRNFEKQLNKQ